MDVPLQLYFVPLCTAGTPDALVIRTGRLPGGSRVGIAFTRPDRLRAAMGETQRWMRLSSSALRAMLLPLGISGIQVDPILVGPSLVSPPIQPSRVAATATTSERVDADLVGVMSG